MSNTWVIVVDVQNDFISGTLAVNESEGIVEKINTVRNKFDTVVFTKDWHPSDHCSFAKNHDKEPFSSIEYKGLPHTLWPVHCVQNTDGAKLHENLVVNEDDITFLKGTDKECECYSAFCDVFGTDTNFANSLKEKNITEIYVCGLALDYCVLQTALDGVKFGFKTLCIFDLTKGVDPNTSFKAVEKLLDSGVKIIHSNDVE